MIAFESLPEKLIHLQNKLLHLRQQDKLLLQNGDDGYASAPSNIALFKYWGKMPNLTQIPTNSSLSFTLGGFRSKTKVSVLGRFFPFEERETAPKMQHQLLLKDENGQSIESSIPKKMAEFLDAILFPYAPEIAIAIESQNNFPTACGIASSASGYAALAGAMADLLQLEKHFSREELQFWLNEWSRLGSGSATRSCQIEKNSLFVAWDLFCENGHISTKTETVVHHEQWQNLSHCVLVLNAAPKSISSSHGHKNAQTSPLFAIRNAGATKKTADLKSAIACFDFQTVSAITEEDAFSMHAVMQTESEPACYLNQEVGSVIGKFIAYRNENELKAFWTLDAGPNIHFLYQPQEEKKLFDFFLAIEKEKSTSFKVYQNKNEYPFLLIGKKEAHS